MVFLVYFDWMKTAYLPPLRQLLWTMLHFPFHLALVLFMQGFTQFIQWSKVIDVFNHLSTDWIVYDPDALAHATSEKVHENMTEEINQFSEIYPPKYADTDDLIQQALDNITEIPNSFWPKLSKYYLVDDYFLPNDSTTNMFVNILNALDTALENSVFAAFEIDLEGELIKESEEKGEENSDQSNAQFATQVDNDTWDRYNLVVRIWTTHFHPHICRD